MRPPRGAAGPGGVGGERPAPLFPVAAGVSAAVPLWVYGIEAGPAAAWAAVLSGGRGGQQRGGDRCGVPSPAEVGRRAPGSVPRLEATPAPQTNPLERPGRRRVCRRKRPETVRFHAASGVRVLAHELMGLCFPGKLRWHEREAKKTTSHSKSRNIHTPKKKRKKNPSSDPTG